MFEFLVPGELVDRDLQLILIRRAPGDPDKGFCPAYHFEMRSTGTMQRLGAINLRVGTEDFLIRYAGQIGFSVDPPHRGHHYAARSCRLLKPLARAHQLTELWVTCNPDNLASARTCELAGGVLVETVELPSGNDMYERGERQKRRYRIELRPVPPLKSR